MDATTLPRHYTEEVSGQNYSVKLESSLNLLFHSSHLLADFAPLALPSQPLTIEVILPCCYVTYSGIYVTSQPGQFSLLLLRFQTLVMSLP